MFYTFIRPKHSADINDWVQNYIIPLNILKRFVEEKKIIFGSSWARLVNDKARGYDAWARLVKEMEKADENEKYQWSPDTIEWIKWVVEKEYQNIVNGFDIKTINTHFDGIRIVSGECFFPHPLKDLEANYLKIDVFREDVKFFWNKTFLSPIVNEENRIGGAVEYIKNMSFDKEELIKFISQITSSSA